MIYFIFNLKNQPQVVTFADIAYLIFKDEEVLERSSSHTITFWNVQFHVFD